MSTIDPDQAFVPPAPLETAVLFLIFNRPDVTLKVFETIRQARPPRLYVAADGPRSDRLGEAEKCREARKIVDQVDWPCQVRTLFRSENLGCKRAVSGAINWFFEHEEEGIILEDDCLPAQSFFWYCQELLEKYRDDKRVWQICGLAFLENKIRMERKASYIFSKYGPIWGWASWRRAWIHYDAELVNWPVMREDQWLNSAYEDVSERRARRKLGDAMFRKEIDTWDYQWGFTKNYQSGLSIVPTRNLVVNLGFGPDATHTKGSSHPLAPVSSGDVVFPMEHPPYVITDTNHDQHYRKELVVPSVSGFFKKAIRRVTRVFQ